MVVQAQEMQRPYWAWGGGVLLQKMNLEKQISVGRFISEAGQGREIWCEYKFGSPWSDQNTESVAM